jgi:hypothetical protein
VANAAHQFRNLGAIMKLYYIVPLEGLQLCSVCDLAKKIHIQVQLFPFLQPHHKTETGTANRC